MTTVTASTDWLEGGGEMGATMRAFDWSTSPLGPRELWPQSLRTIVSTCLNSRFPILVWWGPMLVKIYNDAYRPILGAKHPASLGRPGAEVWPEIWDLIGPMLDGVLNRGEATWSENTMLPLRRHGFDEECYFTFSYSPIREEGGGIGGIFTAVTETTGQVLSERRLRTLRDLGERVNASSSVEALADAATSVLADNAADVPLSILSLASGDDDGSEVVATTGIEVRDGERISTDLAALSGVVELRVLRDVLGLAHEGRTPDDARRAVVLPIVGSNAERRGTLIMGLSAQLAFDERYRDFIGLVVKQISAGLDNLSALEQSKNLAATLAAVDRAKTAFFSNVSHEFRTPLTLLLGPVDDAVLNLTPLEGESLAAVQRNAQRLLRLVNTLLEFSRIEAGRELASYSATDLPALTSDLASAFRSAIERAGLRFTVVCPPLSSRVFVDRAMWEQIVLNLLSNALKFTLHGEIVISLSETKNAVAMRVSDTGCGIPRAELPRLFERFHRVEGAHGRTQEGSGIGLALVQELVALHGGRITVESEVGSGTAFVVTIPTGTAHLPADRIAVEKEVVANDAAVTYINEALRWLPDSATDSHRQHLAEDGAAGARILVADDNADMRDYLRRLLSARWAVTTAADGVEALAVAREGRFDVVVSDVMMPNLDGFGLLRELRADKHTREIPFVMVSARAGEEARVEGLRAGVDDYLVKPFSAGELIARVEAQLTRATIREIEQRHANRLTSVFENAPVGICVFRGPEHVFELANADYLKLVSNRDVVGKPIREALPELEGQGIYELLDRVRSTGEPFVGRSLRVFVNRGPDGAPEECFFDFVYNASRDVHGEIDGVIAVVFDVTQLARARREAEGANRAKDEFMAMLGHELRNPLAPILTAVDLMALRGDSSVEKERAVIERQALHLVRLVDDLLDVSRITSGKVELKKERVEASEVLARAVEMASPMLEQRRHRLTIRVPAHGLLVDGDPGRLAQVFSNLLTNAAKYTEPEGAITVTGSREDGDIAIRFRDSGIGISPEMLPRVFELFAQERQALDRAHGGLGLGLAIVKSLVTMHGGRVQATSDGHRRGSEFVVVLPAAGQVAPTRAKTRVPVFQTRNESPSRPRILVVDDNVDAADLLADSLELMGYTTRVAHDGPSALLIAEDFKPEVALLDIGLPAMNGYELASLLRQKPDLASVRLVAVTGYGQDADRRTAEESGFNAHLVKPVNMEHLRSLMRTMTSPAAS